jgi:mRNA interferase RelE/StbE
MWQIEWSKEAQKQLAKLDSQIKHKILKYLKETLNQWSHPSQRSMLLSDDKSGLWKMRIGDYRLIFKIDNNKFTIFILAVGHRKNVYHH